MLLQIKLNKGCYLIKSLLETTKPLTAVLCAPLRSTVCLYTLQQAWADSVYMYVGGKPTF